jgi:ubiquinone/menaquinone biosynthesis C-methylase UbiE
MGFVEREVKMVPQEDGLIKQFLDKNSKPLKVKQDQHFPSIALDNPFRKWFSNPHKFDCYVMRGAVVADLGCGPGFYTFPLAKCVGAEGVVYAVDSNERQIQIIDKKASRQDINNIKAFAGSAADLSHIPDQSVDFILAEGLLCSMAPADRDAAVSEMKRILKPDGKAYLSSAVGWSSYMEDQPWAEILAGFSVLQRNFAPYKGDRTAVVSLKIS